MGEQNTEREVSLRQLVMIANDWFHYLLSKWKLILIVGIIGAGLGFTVAFLSKPVYTASLSFALDDERNSGGLSGALGLASQFGLDFGESSGGMFSGTNLIELFKSRTMVEKALLTPVVSGNKTISFAEFYIEIQNWREKWSKDPKLKDIYFLPNVSREHFSRAQDSILGSIYGALSADGLNVGQKDKKVDIITIDFLSTDEYFAKYFAEALAKEVSDFYVLNKSKKAQINMDILEKQTDSIRRELNAAITGVAIANDNTFALNPALNVKRAPSAKRQVDVQANTAILTELVKQTELAKVTLRKETPLIQILDRPILPLKKEKLGKLKGIVFGGVLAGGFIILILVGRRFFKNFLNS